MQEYSCNKFSEGSGLKSRRGTKVPLGRRSLGRAVVHEDLGLRFRAVGRLMARYYEAVVAASLLTATEQSLLLTLRHWQGSNPQSMAHLAARAGLEDSATRKALYGLAARRLVRIGKPKSSKSTLLRPDGRTKLVTLTNKGRSFVDATQMRLRRAQIDIGRMLTIPVFATVFQALQKLQAVLPRHTDAWVSAGKNLPPAFSPVSRRSAAAKPRHRPLGGTSGRARTVSAASRRRQRARLTP
jgi:hypothetical protein